MKKLILLFFAFALLLKINAQTAPEESSFPVDLRDLCFEQTYTEHIQVSDDLDIETLTQMDKIKFTTRKYVTQHKEYIGTTGNVAKEIRFVKHTKMFPKWYLHPGRTVYDDTGTKMYYEKYDSLFPGGWIGNKIQTTEYGEYINDYRSGEKYYQEGHSRLSQIAYNRRDSLVKTLGFLYKYAYHVPTTQELEKYELLGYDVITTENKIVVKNDTRTMIWDLVTKTITIQILEYGSVKKTIKRIYVFNDEYKTDLVKKKIVTTPKLFDNGNCYDLIEAWEYSDFTHCDL